VRKEVSVPVGGQDTAVGSSHRQHLRQDGTANGGGHDGDRVVDAKDQRTCKGHLAGGVECLPPLLELGGVLEEELQLFLVSVLFATVIQKGGINVQAVTGDARVAQGTEDVSRSDADLDDDVELAGSQGLVNGLAG